MRLSSIAVILGLALGCASPSVEICREAARCADEDPADCVDEARNGVEDAEDVGCGAEHRALTRCIERHSSCEDGVYTSDASACSEEAQDEIACFIDAAF
ncbi:MAG: hypothetical protein EP330_27915 [Deltaproteobacteria bacterium]|nr:MAG: hypothetical protein EP330_27915 [Deltaproteobacteria bacterium]